MGQPLVDDPFGHGEVDYPASAHQHCSGKLARHAEDQEPGQVGQHLRACAQADGVAADHPGAVLYNVPSPDRGDGEDNGQDHGRPEQEPQPINELTVAVRPGIEMGHPQTRKRSNKAAWDQESPGGAVPAEPARRKPGANWKAPRMEYRLTLRMCSTTGRGDAKNRAFSGVTSAPPVNSAMRTAPAINGTALSTISAAGTSHSALFS